MEDGNCPATKTGDDYGCRPKSSLAVAGTKKYNIVNGHSLNGIDLVNSTLSGSTKQPYNERYKLIDSKFASQKYPRGSRKHDLKNNNFKDNQTRLSGCSTTLRLAADNSNEHKKINNIHINSHETQLFNSGLRYDGCAKRVDDRDLLSLDRNKNKNGDKHSNVHKPMKFKCLKCKAIAFKSLGLLKEHQRECRNVIHKPTSSSAVDHKKVTSRKVYMCSVCNTYYENWNLFLHMREVHNRHICLFCLGMFSKAERLASHLIVKHSVSENKFSDIKDFFSVYSGSLLLMCCYCDKVHTEKDNFTFHDCVNVPKKALSSSTIPKNNNVSPVNAICQINVSNKNHVTESHNGTMTLISPKNAEFANRDKKDDIKTSFTEEITICREKCDRDISEDNSLKDTGTVSHKEESCGEVKQDLKLETHDSADEDLDNEVRNITKGISADLAESNDSFKITHLKNSDCTDWNVIRTDFDTKPLQIETINNNEIERLQVKPALKIAPSSASVSISKPPKRNRRPPKRYDIEDVNVSMEKNVSISENFECDLDLNVVAKAPIQNFEIRLPKKNRRSSKRYEIEDVNLSADKSISISENFECNYTMAEASIQSLEIPIPKLKVKLNKLTNTILASEAINDQEHISMSEGNHISMSEDNHISEDLNKFPIAETSCKDFSDESKGSDCEDQNESKISFTELDIDVAADDVPLIELILDRPIDKYPIHTLLKTFLNSTVHSCIYCNHARKIAVHVKQLALHFLSQHRFSAIVNSITAEELLPETLSLKIKMCLNELGNSFLNLETYDSDDKTLITDFDHIFECFQCYFVTTAHKDLYVHHRKMHQKTMSLCVMCKSTFHSYSELICHLCPGNYNQNGIEMSYRCCLCQSDALPSAFRLMVHLRKRHHACDVCLEKCHNQSKLSNHVWKHKLNHLCYRCGVAYCNKPDITKHLFWKHGTESVLCKKCMQKKWPHVYHFCIPPNTFTCDECSLSFSKAVALKVHKRLHSGDTPYCCSEENCSEKFISKRLLEKHSITHREPPGEAIPICDKNGSIDINATVEQVPVVENNVKEIIPSVTEDKTKTKKVKRDKKSKEIKDNLMMDVNLPALNLSESDSSQESEIDDSKSQAKGLISITESSQNEINEISCNFPKIESDVLQIWDNFNQYQAETHKHNKEIVIVKRHVCDSDHDYCLKETDDRTQTAESNVRLEKRTKLRKKKGKGKTKKKQVKDGHLSLTDSSSESDSSCSCASNCSCSSSSSTSSSGSTSSDSDSSTNLNEKKRVKKSSKRSNSYNKGSDTSHASPVDIMATEEPIPNLISECVEIHIPETDLVTDETETDEDFYDEHPQRMGVFLIPERRSPLILSTINSPLENGSISSPVSPKNSDRKRKKIKPKRKKKGKESVEQMVGASKTLMVPNVPQNKITISLQKNTVQLTDASAINNKKEMMLELDNKRASKRKRVPNKFYGYSSDEEYGFKPQLPPKLEWRKEDLPSPTPSPSFVKSAAPVVPEPQKTIPPLIIPKPVMSSHISSDESDDSDDEGELQICHQQPEVDFNDKQPPKQVFHSDSFKARIAFPKPPGVRQAREGESVYCYCRCPYDEVSEMIACDGTGCNIEWFHFECVGILVPPKGKWYCPQCESKLHPS